jgi:hypothetical protein
VRRPVLSKYGVSAQNERIRKDLRKAFVLFARKTRISAGFPQTFNGSDSEKRREVAYTRIAGPLANGPARY